jgi:ABC-type nitrate/sulfonate/bicarbonate transport system permease component
MAFAPSPSLTDAGSEVEIQIFAVVFIGIVIIGAIGLALNLALNFVETRIVHWKGR